MSTNKRILSLFVCLALLIACLPALESPAAAAAAPGFTGMDDAAAYLRAEMLNRNESITLTLRTTAAPTEETGDILFGMAMGSGDDDLGEIWKTYNWNLSGKVQSGTYILTQPCAPW